MNVPLTAETVMDRMLKAQRVDHVEECMALGAGIAEIERLAADAAWAHAEAASWKAVAHDHSERLKAQGEEIQRLRAALTEAAETVESWGRYASPYFQDKHDLLGDIARIKRALDVPVVQPAPPIARCTKCPRVVNNSMAGQRCLMEFADGSLCDGTLFTVL